MDNDDNCCWICLQPESTLLGRLEQPCACPRLCHIRCLSRWQLQSAGRSEETHCRFCSAAYSDWRQHLAPRADSSGLPPRPATPIMAIFYENQTHRIKVYPGPEGKTRFEQQIRELIQLGDQEDFDIKFECKAPDTGGLLHLDGMNAFDAATHCASLTAAERISKQLQQEQEQHGQQPSQRSDQSQELQQQQCDRRQHNHEHNTAQQEDTDFQDFDEDDLDWQQQQQQQYTELWQYEDHTRHTGLQHLPQLEDAFDAASVPAGVGYQYMCPGA
eukprot:GHUV01005491.1.p1 GENE.GHUV01005491.1~~GHUV01005491.1.p1  ORF type:complete len:273 (+),score=73.35 GHUV01005491.1:181-999(+)